MRQYGNALNPCPTRPWSTSGASRWSRPSGSRSFSFKKFKATIDEYEKWVISYTKDLRLPMMFYTAAVNGVFAF